MIDCSPSWRGRNEYRATAVNLIRVHLLTVGTLIRPRLRETKTQKVAKELLFVMERAQQRSFTVRASVILLQKCLLAEAFFDPLIWAQKKNNCSSLSAI